MKKLKHKKTILHVSQLNSLDKPFSEEEVEQSIKMLKNKKAAGLDRIRNKNNVEMWSPLFDHFFNKSIQFHT